SSPLVQPEAKKGNANIDLEATKDLKLLGIIFGDNPQAIIEDAKNQKTYYLNREQSIGDFIVEDIRDGKVILDYQGQKFELYL
ncbi:MAG: hypothetical protein NC916_01615, partial [Candidatus Omnitrophica bacterium]|nr:hypothetical protein [Candidatus Omnitrophota bacterium]